jgi:hypothetical protein
VRRLPGFIASPWRDGFRIDQSHDGHRLVLEGMPVEHGLGAATGTSAHDPSRRSTQVDVGTVGPAVPGDTTTVAMLGDGRILWSARIGAAAGAVPFVVPLDGVHRFEIRIDQVAPPATRPFAVAFVDLRIDPEFDRRCRDAAIPSAFRYFVTVRRATLIP